MTAAPPGVDRARLDDAVHAAMERWAVPGLTLGLLRDGAVETFAYGVASRETGWPLTADTLFQVGSISKLFTATLVMRLVDEGLLDLDTPVCRSLPDLRLADEAATRAVTLRHLLTHTAGFYGDRFDDHGYGDDALARSIASFDTLRQYFAPGELWAYCNTGFQLAGRAVEVVTGVPFETAMRDRVLAPLGLERSFYFAHEAITYPVAAGHNTSPPPAGERPRPPEVTRIWSRSRCRAAQGGLLSTVADLLRFAAFHMGDGTVAGGRVLGEASLRAMQEPLVPAAISPYWGIGWALDEVEGVRLIGHGGVTNGFQARLTLVPSRRFAFACLTNGNLGGAAHREIGDHLLAECLGLRAARPVTVSLPPAALDRLAGRYTRPDNAVSLARDGDELEVRTEGADPFTREPAIFPVRRAASLDERTFLILDGEAAGSTFDVIPTESGGVRFLRFGGRLYDRAE